MNNKMILLVDDNASDVALTERALAKSQIRSQLVIARDGQQALDFLFGTGTDVARDTTIQPSLILLDLNMPNIDGMTVLKSIRSDPRTRRIPVVILTTSNEEMDRARSYDLGGNSFIRKPVSFEEFASTVAQLGQYWLVDNEPPPKVAL